MTQLDEVAARIAALHFDAATIFKLGVALAPIMLGEPKPVSNGVDPDPPPRRRRAPARQPNGLKQARRPPLERAQIIFAKNPRLTARELQRKARCGAGVAVSVVGKRPDRAGQRERLEAEPAGPD